MTEARLVAKSAIGASTSQSCPCQSAPCLRGACTRADDEDRHAGGVHANRFERADRGQHLLGYRADDDGHYDPRP